MSMNLPWYMPPWLSALQWILEPQGVFQITYVASLVVMVVVGIAFAAVVLQERKEHFPWAYGALVFISVVNFGAGIATGFATEGGNHAFGLSFGLFLALVCIPLFIIVVFGRKKKQESG